MTTPLGNAHNSNHDFIQKAATTVSSFTNGGVLLPQQAMEFVQLKIKSSELLNNRPPCT